MIKKTILFFVAAIIALQAVAQSRDVKRTMREVDAINNMVLYKGYVHYNNFAPSVVKPFPPLSTDVWSVIYFDEQGRVRKYRYEYSCEDYAGEIGYFDEKGKLLHLLIFQEYMGSGYNIRAYLKNSRIISANWSSYNEDTGDGIKKYGKLKNERVPEKINDLYLTYYPNVESMKSLAKINIKMPDDCPKVRFTKAMVGDTTIVNSFVAKMRVAPEINSPINDSICMGRKVIIDDYVKNDNGDGWYRITDIWSGDCKNLWIAEDELELVERVIDEGFTVQEYEQYNTPRDDMRVMLRIEKYKSGEESAEIKIVRSDDWSTLQRIPLDDIPESAWHDIIYVEDFNSDGYKDFIVPYRYDAALNVFLWNPSTKLFELWNGEEEIPFTYKKSKELFVTIQPGSNEEIEPGEALLPEQSSFFPPVLGVNTTLYPMWVIPNYRGMDLFGVFLRDKNDNQRETSEQVSLWVFRDSVCIAAVYLKGEFHGKGGVYSQNYTVSADTSFLLNYSSDQSCYNTGLRANIKTVGQVSSEVDSLGNLNRVNYYKLEYTTPYFFPNDTTKWVGDDFGSVEDNWELHPLKERPYRIFPPEFCRSPFQCWFYITPSKKGSYCTILMSKNEYGEIMDAITLCPDNDSPIEHLVFPPSMRYGNENMNFTGTARFKTALGVFELTPDGWFKKCREE